jgi:hypothetical protein
MRFSLVPTVRNGLVAVVALSLSVFAGAALASAVAKPANVVPLAANDDPIRNGLQILERKAAQSKATAARRVADADGEIVQGWVFTFGDPIISQVR